MSRCHQWFPCEMTSEKQAYKFHTNYTFMLYGLSVTSPLRSFKAVLYSYYKQALVASYIPDDPRSFKYTCLTYNAAHN